MAQHGAVYKIKLLGRWRVMLCGADALEMVLLDRDSNFSSEAGWDAIAGIFSGGLMLQDFAHTGKTDASCRLPSARGALRDYLSPDEWRDGRSDRHLARRNAISFL